MKISRNITWKNWSGSLRFIPGEVVCPESEEEVCSLVRKAGRLNRKVRVVGAGHSSSPLVETGDVLISLKHFTGVEAHDTDRHRATVLGGTIIKEAGKDLWRYGLAMHNTGDVDVQTVAGAIGTGTHGTGKTLKNLSSMLAGVRMVTGTGEIFEADTDDDENLFRALRVSLGTCGIFLKMKLKLVPAFYLHRREWCTTIDKCLEHLEELQENNRRFDFYWYPRSDMAKIRVMNNHDDPMPDVPYAKLQVEKKGRGHLILPKSRHLTFDEMEYALPADNGPDCFREVADRVRQKHRSLVAWRLLYRTIKADRNYLSPMYGRESVTISLHQNAGMPFWDYFEDIEPLFRKYGGRPHWGKKHTLRAGELKPMYEEWDTFMEYRERFDPGQVYLTPYFKKLLILPAS
jgi:FAD/FMN-containing dehydrogenase